ncbi:hypothetical protein CHS0354_022286 [Potamilus streckersoni]|uniref:Elongator complex protein 1 n=1 Tax=Potamilus streckersoni TaxID=2493646 RepID=A0AAE0WE39_9BIVA|nr:hypothetical protein CHS0354_022286 [Potamilus streckersoni]
MKNLKLLDSLRVAEQPDVANLQCMNIDYDTGHIYIATATHLAVLDPKHGEIFAIISLVKEGYVPADGSGKVVGIYYLSDEQALCAATSTGNLLLWNVEQRQLECVGSVDSGFTAIGWSPDICLLILTTGQGTVLMMNREWDPITETPVCAKEFGEAELVQLGWGKKETQFHGSEGKSAAHKRTEDVKPAFPWDDKQPRITWRGDGQYFAVSSISPDTGARRFRVWTRDCILHSTSENADGVEQALAWKPSGSLIASSQRKPNKHDIIFYERNGLRHGEFTLPFAINQVKVCELAWNLESTVLSVWCEDLPDSSVSPIKSYVQLWTVGNYHWYLKQSLHFEEGAGNRVVAVLWDPTHAYRIHIMTANGQYLQYTWAWATNHSWGLTVNDQALVAVIDGSKVLLSPMRNMIVPPPMAAFTLQLPAAVNEVCFAPPPQSNDLAVVLVDGRIAVYRFTDEKTEAVDSSVKVDAAGGSGFSRCCSLPKLIGIIRIEGLPEKLHYPLSWYHFIWNTSDSIIFTTLGGVAVSQHSFIHSSVITASTLQVKSSVPVAGFVYNVSCDPDSGDVAIQLTDGSVFKYDKDSDLVLPWETASGDELKFPLQCSQMSVCQIGGEMAVLGLTERYRFFVNDIEVASNCTSFAVHEEFLLLTTLVHTCRCINRCTQLKVLPTLSDGKAHPFDESIRRVERGSAIVIVVPEDTKLVLQMPRGNLEAIHPRALVLSSVRKKLDNLQFKEAFTLMRKHRINMNLIYDHNPSVFLENVKTFIQQVESVNHFNLFLTDLQEEDVTLTMYTAAYNRFLPDPGRAANPNKIDTICNAFRVALCAQDENKYLLSILTTYVKKSTPQLGEALQLIKALRESNIKAQYVSAEEALTYLLFLVDVNELYDVAMGTYDFDLVLMVAEKSQKDPKEYIPFLNELRRLEPNYQRYTIDKHLRRFKLALLNISKCGDEHFGECLKLVKDHKLYTEALHLFNPSSSQYKEIALSYGNYLTERRSHEEAGIMYVKAEQWELALQAFKTCLQWQQMFFMTAKLGYTHDQEAELARTLAEQLKGQNKHTDAAILLEQYAKDIEEAIVTLIQGSQWTEALRLMYYHKRMDFIESDLKSALIDSYNQQVEILSSMKADFEKYTVRLAVVRQEKAKARQEFLEGGGNVNETDADLFSDTSSATGESIQSSRYTSESQRSSLYSNSTGRSSRNRRKAEHKKWKLKEGSPYEDFALISATAKIIHYVDSLRAEISSLLRAMVQFHYDEKAATLQVQYEGFLSHIEKSIPEIWPEETEKTNLNTVLGPDTTANAIARAVQQGQIVTTEEPLDPVIRVPPSLNKDHKWKLHALEQADV